MFFNFLQRQYFRNILEFFRNFFQNIKNSIRKQLRLMPGLQPIETVSVAFGTMPLGQVLRGTLRVDDNNGLKNNSTHTTTSLRFNNSVYRKIWRKNFPPGTSNGGPPSILPGTA